MLQPENLAYYHPCDDLVDGDSVSWITLSTWVTNFAAGKIGNALTDTDGNTTFFNRSGFGLGLGGVGLVPRKRLTPP